MDDGRREGAGQGRVETPAGVAAAAALRDGGRRAFVDRVPCPRRWSAAAWLHESETEDATMADQGGGGDSLCVCGLSGLG